MASKQKILIVDDDNNIAELISLYPMEKRLSGSFTPSSRT